MASTNDDAGGVILVALGLLTFFWWKNKAGTVTGTGVIGGTVGTGSISGKGCHKCTSGTAGQRITSTQPLSLGAAGGTTRRTPGLQGGGTVVVGTKQPKNAPGGNVRGAGSGAQWSGVSSSSAHGMTPRNAPSNPVNPATSGVWVGHATVTRVTQ